MTDRVHLAASLVPDACRIVADLTRRPPQLRSFVVTGCQGKEGATTLSLALAEAAGRMSATRTLLIDADPRGSLTELADAREARGLRDLEAPSHNAPILDQKLVPGADFVPRGLGAATIADLIVKGVIDGLIEVAQKNRTWLIWDSAPLRDLAETQLLLGRVPEAILLVESDRTPISVAAAAIQEIRDLGGRVACVVRMRARRLLSSRVLA